MEIEGNISKIQQEEAQRKKIISERFLFKVGANINALLTQIRFDIGDIQPSVLNEVDFQNAHDSTWVLCDGQNVEGSAYESLTGRAFAPDFRAEFLRQLNDTDSGRDSGRVLLTAQDSADAPHSHFLIGTGTNPNNNPYIYYQFRNQALGALYNYYSSSGSPDAGITVDGDVDQLNASSQGMLPVNVAINYFVKIN